MIFAPFAPFAVRLMGIDIAWDSFIEAVRVAGLEQPVANEPMARHTSLKLGGPADLYVRVRELDHLVGWVRLAREQGMPYFILGHGSNILVADAGIRGLVIHDDCQQHTLAEDADGQHATLWAESGASLPGLAYLMSKQGWSGLEWATGIPSGVGSAVVNNVGAYGGSVAEVLISATILDADGSIHEYAPAALGFAYRHSQLKGNRGREVVLAASFRLQRDTQEAIAGRIAQYTAHRRSTQPSEPSVGSVFKNPPGDFAGRLLDQAGLKGVRIGDAAVSERHANWVINCGQATAADMRALIEEMQARVRAWFGVELELEIEFVGEWL